MPSCFNGKGAFNLFTFFIAEICTWLLIGLCLHEKMWINWKWSHWVFCCKKKTFLYSTYIYDWLNSILRNNGGTKIWFFTKLIYLVDAHTIWFLHKCCKLTVRLLCYRIVYTDKWKISITKKWFKLIYKQESWNVMSQTFEYLKLWDLSKFSRRARWKMLTR